MGRELGVEINAGRCETVHCSNGQTMQLRVHTMRLAFDFDQADIEVAFFPADRLAVIGRVGILDRYRLLFDDTLGPGFDIELLQSQRPNPGWWRR